MPSKASPAVDVGALCDELGQLENACVAISLTLLPKVRRINVLKARIKSACTADPTETWTVEGKRFGVELGPCALARKIDQAALRKEIGVKAFAESAEWSLSTADKKLPPETIAKVVTESRKGDRRLKLFEKGKAA